MSFCYCILTYDIFHEESYDTGIPTAMKCQYKRPVVEYEVALANALILLLSLLHKVFTCFRSLKNTLNKSGPK